MQLREEIGGLDAGGLNADCPDHQLKNLKLKLELYKTLDEALETVEGEELSPIEKLHGGNLATVSNQRYCGYWSVHALSNCTDIPTAAVQVHGAVMARNQCS